MVKFRSSFRISRRSLPALAVAVALAGSLAGRGAEAAKPEDVFKGQIVITAKRLPTHFSSAGAFIDAVKKARTDKLWPVKEDNENAEWNLEYIAFFAQPLSDNEVSVKFFDVTGGASRFVAGDEQYTRERGSRVFASNIKLGRPEFDTNRKYLMTVETGGRRIAATTFWLRGKGPQYSGKVEFSDDDAKGR